MAGRGARGAAAQAVGAQLPPGERRRRAFDRHQRAPAQRARARARGARAARGQERARDGEMERARLRRVRLYQPRRLASVGRLPDRRAARRRRAARLGHAGRWQARAGHRRRRAVERERAARPRAAAARDIDRARPGLRPRDRQRLRFRRARAGDGQAERAADERHQLPRQLAARQQHHACAARLGDRQPGRARAACAPGGVPAVSGRPARAARRARAAGEPA